MNLLFGGALLAAWIGLIVFLVADYRAGRYDMLTITIRSAMLLTLVYASVSGFRAARKYRPSEWKS